MTEMTRVSYHAAMVHHGWSLRADDISAVRDAGHVTVRCPLWRHSDSVPHEAVDLMLRSTFIGQDFENVRDAQQQLLRLIISDHLHSNAHHTWSVVSSTVRRVRCAKMYRYQIFCLSNALHSSIRQNIKSLAPISGLRCPFSGQSVKNFKWP